MPNEKLTRAITNAIASYFSIGPLIGKPKAVSIHKINQVWQIETKKNRFAVKRVLSRPLYEETGKIACAFKKAGLPVVTALKGMYQQGSNYFELFEWIEGKVLSVDKVLPNQIEEIGSILFKLHTVDLIPAQFELASLNNLFYEYQFDKGEWEKLVAQACALKIKCKDKLQSLLPTLIEVSKSSQEVIKKFKSTRLLSHRDISPCNVIWQPDGSPLIIDWELAGLIHPSIEVMGAAFDWSIVRHDKIDEHRYHALIHGYQQAGGSFTGIHRALTALMGTWLSWLLVNLQNFIEGKSLHWAENEVVRTLRTFDHVITTTKIGNY